MGKRYGLFYKATGTFREKLSAEAGIKYYESSKNKLDMQEKN